MPDSAANEYQLAPGSGPGGPTYPRSGAEGLAAGTINPHIFFPAMQVTLIPGTADIMRPGTIAADQSRSKHGR